jgi:hypothetical protein
MRTESDPGRLSSLIDPVVGEIFLLRNGEARRRPYAAGKFMSRSHQDPGLRPLWPIYVRTLVAAQLPLKTNF